MRKHLVLLAMLLPLLLCVSTARAQDLDFLVTPPEMTGAPGETVTYLGFLDNSLGYTAWFVGLGVTLYGVDPGDISLEFSFADLPDGESRSENLFSVYISPSLAEGSYYGEADLEYEYDSGGGNLIQNIRLDVRNPVPEPAVIQLPVLLGIAGLGMGLRRRRTA